MNTHVTSNEERIIQMIQNHFNNIRQKQKQDRDTTSITDEIRFILTFTNDSVMHPAPLLKKMGIMIIRQKLLPLPSLPPLIQTPQFQPQNKQPKTVLDPIQPILNRQDKHLSNKKLVAINYNLLTNQLNTQRNRIIIALQREGWHDYTEEQFTKTDLLSPLIGTIAVKEWSLLFYPEDTNLSRYIAENPRIIASQESLQQSNDTSNNNNINQGDSNLKEGNHFPLVSVHYERRFNDFDLASFPPSTEKPILSIFKADSFSFKMSDSNLK